MTEQETEKRKRLDLLYKKISEAELRVNEIIDSLRMPGDIYIMPRIEDEKIKLGSAINIDKV